MSPTYERSPTCVRQVFRISFPSSPTSPNLTTSSAKKNNNKKSVTFSDDIHVHEIPTLTEEEKNDMFFNNKQDAQNAKLQMKLLRTYYKAGRPFRRRMTKLVLQHQHDHNVSRRGRQNPSYYSSLDDQLLAQKCTTAAKMATFMALGRAQTLINELANDDE